MWWNEIWPQMAGIMFLIILVFPTNASKSFFTTLYFKNVVTLPLLLKKPPYIKLFSSNSYLNTSSQVCDV